MSASDSQSTTESVSFEKSKKRHPLYLMWRAPAHPFRRRSAYELKEVGFRVGIVILVVVFFKQFLLAAVIAAFAFLVYGVASVDPEEVVNRIDKNGITTGGETYIWEDLDYFYFTVIYGHEVLNVVTLGYKSSHLVMMMGEMNKDKVREFIEDYIPYRNRPSVSVFERSVNRLSRWFSLD